MVRLSIMAKREKNSPNHSDNQMNQSKIAGGNPPVDDPKANYPKDGQKTGRRNEKPISKQVADNQENFVDIIALIRSVQVSDGKEACFRSGQAYCDQLDCVWRIYCLQNP
jgi:hypothetical protein